MIMRDILALIITFAAALIWLRINDFFAQRGWVSSRTSRKFIHIGTGPIFVLCWLIFSNAAYTRYLAAVVPFTITLQFIFVGFGIIKDEGAVQGMSRTGDPAEILRGPVYYGIVFVLLTIIFWKDSPIGIIALMMLCGGDGLAEILGRKFGKLKLPWNKGKSWLGSLGFFSGGWVLSFFLIGVYVAAGVFSNKLGVYLLPITYIAAVSTIIESITPHDWDNITVPIAAVGIGLFLF
jgi:phytol kinase